MSSAAWFMRRNAISHKDLRVIYPLAAVAGVAAGFAGCRPTGQPWLDPVLAGALVALVTWLGASASWWSLCALGLAAAAAAGTTLGLAAACIVAACGMYLGSYRQNLAWLRSLAVAIAAQVLVRLATNPFFGFSALVAGGVFILLSGVCAGRRRSLVRRRVAVGVGVALGVCLFAFIMFAARVFLVRTQLEDGYQGMLDGLSQLQAGDARTAAATLHDAAEQLREVADAAESVWTQPARLVPVVAQHRNALAELVSHAASAADAAADALDATDLDSLTIDRGIIDVGAVALLAEPLAELESAVEGLQGALQSADSPWLIEPVATRLHRYQRRAEQAAVQARASATAARVGPAMLGANEQRTYLIGFVSPAEARAQIGLIGDYAIITIDLGLISRTEFGRVNELGNEIREANRIPLETTQEFRSLYGPAVLDRDGNANDSFWSNVTMNPDLPGVAPLMADVWEATGHSPLDGVFLIDPAGLAALLSATGPIEVEGLDRPLTANNVEHFLYVDQYRQDDTTQRTDVLDAVATATLDAMLDGQLPAPQQLARLLGPAATGGDIIGWARRPEEQVLMQHIGMAGALPSVADRDGLAVITNNASANKIDSFLQRTIAYDAHVHDGAVTATVTVTLRNNAPTSGYPSYVIGSEFLNLPLGTNRSLLSVYTPLTWTSATLDGEAVGLSSGSQDGWNAYTVRLDMAPGSTHVLVLDLVGYIDGDYSFALRPQPLPTDDTYAIHIDGDLTVDIVGSIGRTTVFDRSGARALR